jgi:predicted component of type VI protein secretion system
VLTATFSNISATSWRPVLVVEEGGLSGERTLFSSFDSKSASTVKQNTIKS